MPVKRIGSETNERRVAVSLAGRRGELELVRRGLHDDEPTVRAAAFSELARIRAIDADDVASAIADPEAIVRRRICELSTSCPAGDFAALLSDDDPAVVEAAAYACGEQEIAAALGGLVEIATGHSDALCRESAVAALGVLGLDGGLTAVIRALGDVAAVRRRAVIALANYEGAEVTEALQAALGDRDWQVRQAAEDVLGINRTSTR